MNITTTILAVGSALRHAQSLGVPVHVLVGMTWLDGLVVDVDGEGVVLSSPTGESLVVRIAGITAVRVERSHEPSQVTPERPSYDGLPFPHPSPADLTTLSSVPTPADSRVSTGVSG